MKRHLVSGAAAFLAATFAWSPASAQDGVIPAEVEASVRAAVDDGSRIGVVIGYAREGRSAFYSFGSTAAKGGGPVNPDTIFATGSVTKLFTAETLAALALAGEVGLDTSLEEIWPGLPSAKEITLGELATHRAGLPRDIPAGALTGNDEAVLLAALEMAPAADEVAYSNAGMAILARALAHRTGVSTPKLVEHLVSEPMELHSTGYEPVDADRLAHPHVGGADITGMRPRTVEIARGAGGLHSTARDLLSFLERHLGIRADPSGEIVELSLSGMNGVPLGWQVHAQGDRRIFHHSGEANGYQAFVGFHRDDGGVAVVLLTNSSDQDDLQNIALHLLDPAAPLPVFGSRAGAPVSAGLGDLAGSYTIQGEDNLIEFVDLGDALGYLETTPDGGVVRRARLEQSGPGAFRLTGTPIRIAFEGSDRAYLTVGEQTMTLVRRD